MRCPCGAFTVAAMACWWRCVAFHAIAGAKTPPKKTQAGAATAVAAARAKDGQATRGAREAAMRAVARAQDARLGRWLGRVGWYCPGVFLFPRRRSWPIQRPTS